MKTTQKIILISIVIVIIIIGLIVTILKLKAMGTDNENSNSKFENQDFYIPVSELQDVNNRNKYFAVKKIVNSYFSYIEELNGDKKILFETDDEEAIKKEQQQEAIKILKQIIGKEDEKQNYITDDSIKKEGEKYSKGYLPKISKMKVTEKSANINVYIIEATVGEVDTTIAVKTDSENMTFSIFPESYLKESNFDNDKILAKISDNNIEENSYNTYTYNNITDEYMAKEYFNDYINNVKNDISKAYNSLEPNYAMQRFGSIDNYKKYVDSKVEELENITLKKYQVKNENGCNQYVLIDSNENYYIIRENKIMQYNIMLDTYTIAVPEYEEKYQKANNQQKVAYCIDRFIQAINDENYKFAYSLLSEGFKSNYFKTQTSFEQYIQTHLKDKNKATYKTFNTQGEIYTYAVNLINSEENINPVEKTFIVKLKEGTDFEMSFNVE